MAFGMDMARSLVLGEFEEVGEEEGFLLLSPVAESETEELEAAEEEEVAAAEEVDDDEEVVGGLRGERSKDLSGVRLGVGTSRLCPVSTLSDILFRTMLCTFSGSLGTYSMLPVGE